MSRESIFKRLQNTGAMPTPSSVALEIMRLCRDSTSSLNDIAEVVETDPSLSSELLRIANSALLSTGTRVASIRKATVKLGMKTVTRLVLCFSLLSENKAGACKLFDYQTFWSLSLARAVAARFLANLNSHGDPDEYFVCGLLAHMGNLALASLFPEEYSLILAEQLDEESLLRREHEQFEINHRDLTGEMFRDWGLPGHYARAVVLSDEECSGESTNTDLSSLCATLQLADAVARVCMQEIPVDARITDAERRAEALGLSEADFAAIFDTVVGKWQQWGLVFQVPTKDCPPYLELKSLNHSDLEDRTISGAAADTTVLVVDDDPLTLLNMERFLQKSGRKVLTAEDGDQALMLAVEKQPQLIITDWRMPYNGIELCRILRKTKSTRHIYIIMLTGRESDDELVQAFDAGADDYVVKPFNPRVLEARIQSGERLIRYQQMIHRDREVIEKYAASLSSANLSLEKMAMTDALTELPNRRSALNRLKGAVAEAQRRMEPLCSIMIDIDHFKQINDRYGHDIGDRVLRELSSIFTANARSYDMVSRMGGEEFLIICSRSTLEETRKLAERLRHTVEDFRFEYGNASLSTTISLGVACWQEDMLSDEDLIRVADRALYKAKNLGRNRVEQEKDNDN